MARAVLTEAKRVQRRRETSRTSAARARAKDPEKFKRRTRAWRSKNGDQVRAKERATWPGRAPAKNAALRAKRKADPEGTRAQKLRHLYGLSREDLARMLAEQDGKCAICGREERVETNGKKHRLAIDHDHKTGAVRGLLCRPCNRAIGLLGDDPERIERAVAYLRRKT